MEKLSKLYLKCPTCHDYNLPAKTWKGEHDIIYGLFRIHYNINDLAYPCEWSGLAKEAERIPIEWEVR